MDFTYAFQPCGSRQLVRKGDSGKTQVCFQPWQGCFAGAAPARAYALLDSRKMIRLNGYHEEGSVSIHPISRPCIAALRLCTLRKQWDFRT